MSEDWPDVEGALRDYLTANYDFGNSAATGVFFAVPDEPVFPLVTIIRIAGGEGPGEAPLDVALLQVDVRGRVKALAQCMAVTQAVRKALSALRGPYTVAGKATIHGAVVVDVRRFPEPRAQDTDGRVGERPRYVLTVQVASTAASA